MEKTKAELNKEIKLIAEFMGMEIHTINGVAGVTIDGCLGHLDRLKYHSSWNCLMPVVAKITATGKAKPSWYDVKYRLMDADIDGVFESVVIAIKNITTP